MWTNRRSLSVKLPRIGSLCLLALGFVQMVAAWCSAADPQAAERQVAVKSPAARVLLLPARERVKAADGKGPEEIRERTLQWDPKKTCIVVCDMWDEHWCAGASRRVAQMAPRMNEVLKKARSQGVFIIHCPSSCMQHYEGTPQRALALQAPKVAAKVPLQRWCYLDKAREGSLPIDDRDGGCDCDPTCEKGNPWRKQIETLEIQAGDAITDSDEAYFLMQQRGIDNVIVMGVHTNMCVLGRPFSIRQMVYQEKNVVLMRDMTDTMYNPRSAPFVSHFTGNDLVAEHIERHWCPTILSTAFLAGKPFQFPEDKRKHLVMMIGEDEYKTEHTLPEFARKQLGKDFRVSSVFAQPKNPNDFPGIALLAEADVALISVRRRPLPADQLDVVRKYVQSGKPLVAIRTTSHAFALRNDQPPKQGLTTWPGFDQEVLGCHYAGHQGNNIQTYIWTAPEARQHPLLAGVQTTEFPVKSSLYRSRPLVEGAQVLLMGRAEEGKPHEPVAWTRTTKEGGKVFYSSLGHVGDFQTPAFTTLLRNGIYWAAGLPLPKATESGAEPAK